LYYVHDLVNYKKNILNLKKQEWLNPFAAHRIYFSFVIKSM